MQAVKLVGYDLIGRNTQLLSEGVITALIAQLSLIHIWVPGIGLSRLIGMD